LDLISPKLEDARFQFELAEARIELFVAHGDLTKEMGGLKLATMELQHLVEATADELRLFFFKTKMELDQTPVDQKVNRHQKYIEEYSEKMKAFREHKLKIYAEIAPICSQFRNLAHSHIENLIESGERKT
jgi:competence protein ComGF